MYLSPAISGGGITKFKKHMRKPSTKKKPIGKHEPVPQLHRKNGPIHHVLPVKKAYEKTTFRSSWFLTLLNILLLVLLVYFGFSTVKNLRNAGLELEALAVAAPAPASNAALPENVPPSLNDYRIISERNLFNVSEEEAPGPKKEIAVEKLAPAQKDLGLQLVGTVVADDSRLSRAFIDNHKTRQQEAYREGDKAGDVLIKKVLRNRVIIATKEGDKLLTVEIETSGKSKKISTAAPQIPRSSTLRSPTAGNVSSGARTRHISLDRQEVEDSLANIDGILQELTLTPYMRFQKPAGFRISNLPRDSIFNKMGLSSKDVIVGINDQKITSPDQAADFLQTLAEGDEVTIKARRRLRTRRIILNFE
jgi:general secretion pathway protein C